MKMLAPVLQYLVDFIRIVENGSTDFREWKGAVCPKVEQSTGRAIQQSAYLLGLYPASSGWWSPALFSKHSAQRLHQFLLELLEISERYQLISVYRPAAARWLFL
ncbi:hypothetical protein WJU16_22205 [Chitinophaga pollutisoli]|uniref:Uncharacterized protein n=1 Tax=Chitinophaga pollutisoli TaxID=3133966 RepID=A0ABZ2YMM6_9BACT|nr:hypothetical protein [Chitinophaga rhizosphaerae]